MTNNPFVVNSLVPENRENGGIYQLTDGSVSPTRLVRTNDDGFDVEETIMALAKSMKFVDRDGNVCDIALRTGRVPSEEPEAVRYEMVITADLIRQGQIPLACCPYTSEFRHIKRGPLVTPPDGVQACDGHPDGCQHMRKIIIERQRKCRQRYDAQQLQMRRMNEGDIKEMMEGFGKIFGEAVANAKGTLKGSRANLASDKSEKDE